MTGKPNLPIVEVSRMKGLTEAGIASAASRLVGIFAGEDGGWIGSCTGAVLAALVPLHSPLGKRCRVWAATSSFITANACAAGHLDWSFTHSQSGHNLAPLIVLDIVAMTMIIRGSFHLIHGAPFEAVADMVEEPAYRECDLDR